MADVVIISKVQTAERANIQTVRDNVRSLNSSAKLIEANSPIIVDGAEDMAGKKVLVVEDGPTVTHGDMAYGAGLIAAEEAGAIIVDPRPYAVGPIAETFKNFPHLTKILPAMGYSDEQLSALEETIEKADCDIVVTGTPIDIKRLVNVSKPIIRAGYEMEEIGHPNLEDILTEWWDRMQTGM